MQKKFFGTDGIRGPVGEFPISADWFLKLGWAVGRALSKNKHGKVLIGKDTRISGYMFESALEAGLVASGTDVLLLGPMPTPGIAYLTKTLRGDAGIVISASHNSYIDNGVKFFSPSGMKLSDELEATIERYIEQPMSTVKPRNLGRATRINDAQGRYIEFCKSTMQADISFRGMKIVLDSANGAAYNVAPHVFSELGADVINIGDNPNGLNINQKCGATSTDTLSSKVIAEKADFGIALDGDGDRVIFVDHTGEVVDGDELVFMIARWYALTGKEIGGVVGTVMSNLGLEIALQKLKIPFCRTRVGDRHIIQELHQRNWMVGGEASGHIICLDAHSTGDGIISALRVMSAMNHFGHTLAELRQHMQKHPQMLVNIPIKKQIDLDSSNIKNAVSNAKHKLKKEGRVLLRPSGTEPLIRIMVEGKDKDLIKSVADELSTVLIAETGN